MNANEPPKRIEQNKFVARVMNPLVVALSAAPVLTVTGRKSGRELKLPLNPMTVEGSVYLVATRGESEWVKNLRAAGVAKLKYKGETRKVRPVEVTGEEQEKVVNEYRRKYKSIDNLYFKKLPNSKDHPTFRMEEA